MDRYSFLRMVLPPLSEGDAYVGHYASIASGNDIHWNVNYNSIEEMADAAVAESSRGNTAYFALGTFANNVVTKASGKQKIERKAAQAVEFKTLALDIDAGKGEGSASYPTSKEAAIALLEFLKKTDLPPPMIVASGHGLHVYWPLTEPIRVPQWRSMGKQLLALCNEHGFIVDASKVHDPSMVLRPLDTLNKGNPVRVIAAGSGLVGTLAFSEKLEALAPKVLRMPRQGKKPVGQIVEEQSATDKMLGDFKDEYDFIDPEQVLAACAQLRAATADGGRNASYWQWYIALATAKYTADPEAVAIEWTKNHPDFSLDSMRKQMEEWRVEGMPTCAGINEKLSQGICAKCPHWAKNTSLFKLGKPLPKQLQANSPPPAPVESEEQSEPLPPQDFIIDPKKCSPSFDPPFPFVRTVKGVMVTIKEEGAGESHEEVCPYDLFPINMVRDPTLNFAAFEWVWNKPHVGYVTMLVRASAIFNDSSTTELNNILADNGVLISGKRKQLYMAAYMRAYSLLLQKHQASIDLYDSFGWKEDYEKFVIGSTELRREKDGTVTSHEVGVSKLIATKKYDKTFGVKGNMDEWITWTKILDHPDLHLHQVELARGFMTPLICFTGLRGVVFSLVGDTGHGKSTMQRWAASIYGNPDRVNTTAQDTQMALVQRLGIWGNLPVGVDETSLVKPDFLANLIYWGSQGQDRNRVSEDNQALQWALTLSMSTNNSVRDKLSSFGADVQALHMRLLEFPLPSSPLFAEGSDMGRRMYLMPADSYGHVGRVYLAHLLRLGPDRIRTEFEEALRTFPARYGVNFTGPERFWHISAVAMDLALRYAHSLGLIKFDYVRGIKAMLASLLEQRENVSGRKLDTYDMVADYLSTHNGMALTMLYRGGKAAPREPWPRGEVRIRKELYFQGDNKMPSSGFFYVDKTHFQNWLVTRGFDVKHALDTMFEDKAAFKPGKNGRIYLGKDSGISLPACSAIGFNMGYARFLGMLNQHEYSDIVVDITKTKEKNNDT